MVLDSKTVYSHIFDPHKLAKPQQHGVDLTISRLCELETETDTGVYKNETKAAAEIEVEPNFQTGLKGWWVYANKTYAVYFDQGVVVPKDCKANIIHRSSIARCGGIIYSGEYDPGYKTSNIGAFLVSPNNSFFIEYGARVAQIFMSKIEGEAPQYNGQFQTSFDPNEGIGGEN